MNITENPFTGPVNTALIIEELPQIVAQGAKRWFISRVNIRSYHPNWPKMAFEDGGAPEFEELEDAEKFCTDRQVPFEVRPVEKAD